MINLTNYTYVDVNALSYTDAMFVKYDDCVNYLTQRDYNFVWLFVIAYFIDYTVNLLFNIPKTQISTANKIKLVESFKFLSFILKSIAIAYFMIGVL